MRNASIALKIQRLQQKLDKEKRNLAQAITQDKVFHETKQLQLKIKALEDEKSKLQGGLQQ